MVGSIAPCAAGLSITAATSADEILHRFSACGNGLLPDEAAMARRTLRAAADHGDSNAAITYAFTVLNPSYWPALGVPVTDAVQVMDDCAARGDAQCEYVLGLMFREGKGVLQDYEVAANWFERSATGGEDASAEEIARAYANGRGRHRDLAVAYTWANIAAARASDEVTRARVTELRARLVSYLGPNQISLAQQRALEWRPGISLPAEMPVDEASSYASAPAASFNGHVLLLSLAALCGQLIVAMVPGFILGYVLWRAIDKTRLSLAAEALAFVCAWIVSVPSLWILALLLNFHTFTADFRYTISATTACCVAGLLVISKFARSFPTWRWLSRPLATGAAT
jgi:hypothetical protein